MKASKPLPSMSRLETPIAAQIFVMQRSTQ